jgi:hypothetical protein
MQAAAVETNAALIELRLSKPQQLFNSFDPSPFHEKDLDRDAEEYIVGSADEFPLTRPGRLVIHLPPEQLAVAEELGLRRAVQNYFAYRRQETWRRIRFLFREGRSALAIGLAFLIVCMVVRQLAVAFMGDTSARILQEGLLILGWVAMWRPLQIFLYEWWPLRHRGRVFNKLAKMPVEILASDRPS